MLQRVISIITVLFISCAFYTEAFPSNQELTLAVSANFCAPIKDIVKQFKKTHPVIIHVICASTTVLYNQIRNGAPYDIFFSADLQHSNLLIQQHIASQKNMFTYAQGSLWLYSTNAIAHQSLSHFLKQSCKGNMIVIANPKFSPYGIASKEMLVSLGLWGQLDACLVRADNVSGVSTYLNSRAANTGFISNSQIKTTLHPVTLIKVPKNLYQPILQAAVVLKFKPITNSFKLYFTSNVVKNILTKYGYLYPYKQ